MQSVLKSLSSLKSSFPAVSSDIIFFLGLGSIAFVGASLVTTLLSFVSARTLGGFCRRRPYKAGDWAVVTGASDGIGEATAITLAKRGLNVVLIARSKDKLDAVAAKIRESAPKVQVEIHVADFSKTDIYGGIKKGVFLRARVSLRAWREG
jgi:hypothetical protein